MTRPAATTGNHPLPASRGANAIQRVEIIRMPSGSIVSIPALEPINLSQARLNKAVVFALFVNFGIWGLLALAVWALFFSAL